MMYMYSFPQNQQTLLQTYVKYKSTCVCMPVLFRQVNTSAWHLENP